MNSQLYKQAVKNVDQKRKQELAEDIKEETREEYLRLKFESEKVIADAPTLEKIKRLYKKCLKLPAVQMYDAPYLSHKAGILKNYIKTGKYHQQELKELEEFVKHRLELKKK